MKNYIFFHCTLEQYFLLRRAVQINHVNKSDLPSRLEDIMMYVYTYTPVYVHTETPQKRCWSGGDADKTLLLPARLTEVFSSLSPAELPWLLDCEYEMRNTV